MSAFSATYFRSLISGARCRPLLLGGLPSSSSSLSRNPVVNNVNVGGFPSCVVVVPVRGKADDRRALVNSMPIKDMGTQGEREMDIDLMSKMGQEALLFPDISTPDMLVDGVKFKNLPICHIKVSKNNTLLHLTDAVGKYIVYRSCGLEGFKNTRKGTNIAAQTTAITFAGMAKAKGVTTIRIAIQGLGPGRMSSVKGLQMAGMKIVAIADTTPISYNPPRPRKARRI